METFVWLVCLFSGCSGLQWQRIYQENSNLMNFCLQIHIKADQRAFSSPSPSAVIVIHGMYFDLFRDWRFRFSPTLRRVWPNGSCSTLRTQPSQKDAFDATKKETRPPNASLHTCSNLISEKPHSEKCRLSGCWPRKNLGDFFDW